MRKDHWIDAAIAGCRAHTDDGIFIEPTKLPRERCHGERGEKEMALWWGR